MDSSSVTIIMEIALETVASMYIFRSTSELCSRKTAWRGGKPPARLPAPIVQRHGEALTALSVGM